MIGLKGNTQKLNVSERVKEYYQFANEQKAKNQGSWSNQEQKKYIIFLQLFKKQLQNKQKRKNAKIFKEMARFINSRDGIQCRSHHMKLLRTHSKIRKIISHFKKELNFSLQVCPNFDFPKMDHSPSNQLVKDPLIKKQIQEPQQQKLYYGEAESIKNMSISSQNQGLFKYQVPCFDFLWVVPAPILLYSPLTVFQQHRNLP